MQESKTTVTILRTDAARGRVVAAVLQLVHLVFIRPRHRTDIPRCNGTSSNQLTTSPRVLSHHDVLLPSTRQTRRSIPIPYFAPHAATDASFELRRTVLVTQRMLDSLSSFLPRPMRGHRSANHVESRGVITRIYPYTSAGSAPIFTGLGACGRIC